MSPRLAKQRVILACRFLNGELTFGEYGAQTRAVVKKQRSYNRKRIVSLALLEAWNNGSA